VASFIGNPARNLMNGEMTDGTVRCDHVEIGGLTAPNGPVTLGFRAEDATIEAQGQMEAPVYSRELLGDATRVTVKAGGALVAVKAGKDYREKIGAPVAASIPASICHLFDHETGQHL
jgi:multiple sugar transport system ATP-binding protein